MREGLFVFRQEIDGAQSLGYATAMTTITGMERTVLAAIALNSKPFANGKGASTPRKLLAPLAARSVRVSWRTYLSRCSSGNCSLAYIRTSTSNVGSCTI